MPMDNVTIKDFVLVIEVVLARFDIVEIGICWC